MVVLDEVEVCGDASFHEVLPSNYVLANCESFHSGLHCSKRGEGFVAPHHDVLRNPVGEFQVCEVFLAEPCAQVFCRFNQ